MPWCTFLAWVLGHWRNYYGQKKRRVHILRYFDKYGKFWRYDISQFQFPAKDPTSTVHTYCKYCTVYSVQCIRPFNTFYSVVYRSVVFIKWSIASSIYYLLLFTNMLLYKNMRTYPYCTKVQRKEGEIPKSETEGSDIRNLLEKRPIVVYKNLEGCHRIAVRKGSQIRCF
jgi:hypothetical protein